MKIQTKDLICTALDWAVADLLGYKPEVCSCGPLFSKGYYAPVVRYKLFSPTTNWKHGGPILEWLVKNGMLLEAIDEGYTAGANPLPAFKATLTKWETVARGDTILLAALRCFVELKCGIDADIPEKLAQ